MLANAMRQICIGRLAHRIREQARSHILIRFLQQKAQWAQTETPARGRGFFASLQPYFNLAMAALRVLLGRMALLVSSGFGA